MDKFCMGHASASDWRGAVEACVERLEPPPGANLGFVYVTDELAADMGKITDFLVRHTGVAEWVGTTGIGICATGREYFDEPAVAAMAGRFPEGSFSVFERFDDNRADFLAGRCAWLERGEGHFGVVHADPRHAKTPELISALAETAGCFLVGGLSSSRGTYAQVAGKPTDGALSGVLFSTDVAVATALTQGCSPIGPVHEISNCQGNIAIQLDGRAALDVFKEDIGEALARDLERVHGYIFAAFPVLGSDRADYMVRNLIGLDADQGLVAIGALLEKGQRIMFCRRDRATARADLERMLADLKRRATGPAKGAVYYTCLGRGPHMFGKPSAELGHIQREIGDVPLVGFFCNGEISHDRLYGYTGVLSLFL